LRTAQGHGWQLEFAMRSRLHRLAELGQSVWIDYLSRDLILSGALARAVEEDAVVGVTSNPTIFENALSQSDAYDAQLAGHPGGNAKRVFLDLAMRDVSTACDVLRPVWESTAGRDGYVSIEVDPHLAGDTEATIDEATSLHEAIAKPNLLVKIPATSAGIGAFEEMIARERSINATLIFSLSRHAQVIEAYLHGLERLIVPAVTPGASTRSQAFSSHASTVRPIVAWRRSIAMI
jgi:transaldolase